MLKLINVKKSFNNQEILKGVTFNAQNGRLTVLEGQNGAGKSTLFNIIAGVLSHDGGQIILKEINVNELAAIDRARHIAILIQDPKASSVPSLSVLENCALALLKGKRASLCSAITKVRKQKIVDHLSTLGLSYQKELLQPIGLLSGGQRQIFAFAMATMSKPNLLLLDEPTAALDEKSSHRLMGLIKRFVSDWQISAVMISHDHAINRQYADDTFTLQDGSIHS